MFNNNTTSSGAPGLFGNNTTGATTGGLFSSNNAATTNPAPATGQATGGSNLFSGGATGGAATTGMFSNTQTGQPATSGGMFSNSTATGTQPAAQTGGGFFSNTPATTAPATNTGGATGATGGLFGNNSANPSSSTNQQPASTAQATGGLFSNSTTVTPPAATTAQPAATNPAPTTTGGLFSNSTTTPTVTAPATTGPTTTGNLFGGGTTTTAGAGTSTTSGLFGGGASTTTGAKPDEKKRDADTELLMNSYLSTVLNKWKDTMKDQVEEFQRVAVDIRKNEAELIKNHQLIYNVNTVHQSVKDEYKTLEDHLTKLEKDQEIIEKQLLEFSSELERLVKVQTQTDPRSSGSLLDKCKQLNERMSKVDTEVESMIQSMNANTHAPEKVDPQQISVNVSIMLNNYFQTLQNLELETLGTRRRLEDLCRRNNF